MRRIKTFIKRKIANTMIGKVFISFLNHIIYYQWIIGRIIINRGFNIFDFDPNEIFYIDPSQIIFRSKRARKTSVDLGKVIDGDWDLWNVRWDDHDQVRWLYERFIAKKEWAETTYYKTYQNYFKTGRWTPPLNGNERHLVMASEAQEDDDIFDENFRTIEELNYRCEKIDNLMNSIKNQGILPQFEISKIYDPLLMNDNIIIDIARNGRLLFCDGKHRFTIANILGLRNIPVKVGKRHPEWINFIKELEEFLLMNGTHYLPVKHPDFIRMPFINSENLLAIIGNNLKIKNGTLLDIGARLGHLSLFFEKTGFKCTAIETDHRTIHFLEKIIAMENSRIQILKKDILSIEENLVFDVVLAFNIFQDLIREEKLYKKLIAVLKKMKIKYMYFQPCLKEELITRESYKIFDPREFVNFILENSCLNNYELIGYEPENRRPVYLLSV